MAAVARGEKPAQNGQARKHSSRLTRFLGC
jgi:hypothetical protein